MKTNKCNAMNESKGLQYFTQKAKTLFVAFINRVKHGAFAKPQRSKTYVLPQNLYHRCNELPLYIFINCVCDKRYSQLVKHGRAKDKDISLAWEMIYGEFTEMSGNPTSKLLISLSKDISFHESKLRAVTLCLRVLQYRPDQRCINVLKSYGYDFPFDITNPVEYAESLEKVAKRLGPVIFTVQQKSAEYKRETSLVQSKPITRESFDQQIAVLTKHVGFRIDPKVTTVTEFVEYRKMYEAEMKAIRKANEKQRAYISNNNLANVG